MRNNKITFIYSVEITLFVVFIFMQNFAVIRTESFGISALFLFLLFISIKNRIFISRIFVPTMILLFFNIFVFFSSLLNNYFNIIRILRWNMLIIVAYFTYRYVQSIIDKGYYNDLVNKFFKVGFCVNVYGIYEFFAPKYNLPLFLNIFNNNPSFGKPKGIYSYYGGWVDLPRIYTLFFEPSVYSTFLVLLLMFLILDKDIRNKKVYFCFAFINLILTFARTGWGIFIYCIGVYIIFKILKKLGLSEALYSFISVFVLMIPFFNLLLMYIANIYIFNDLSSLGRTNSAVYYLAKTFDNAKTFLFGHGLGHISFSWTKDLWYEKGVEGFAHNGYIEFLYELGVILFLVTLSYIFICVKRIKNYRNRTILLGIIGSVSSFSSTYQIESILALIIVIFCYSIHHEKIQYKN